MSRDKEEDIIDVDGSDEGEEEYEVESITGFKWEVSIGAVELSCRQLAKASRSRTLCLFSVLLVLELLRMAEVGCKLCNALMQCGSA